MLLKINRPVFIFFFLGACAAQGQNQINFSNNNANYNPPAPQAQINDSNLSNENNMNNNKQATNQMNAEDTNAPAFEQQVQQQASNEAIEPSLDNGFHIRFKMKEPSIAESGNSSASSTSHKSKKGASSSRKSMRIKRRFKHILPSSKRKYQTSLCFNF